MNRFSNSQACKDFRRENLNNQNSAIGSSNMNAGDFLRRSRNNLDKDHVQIIPYFKDEKKLSKRNDPCERKKNSPLWKNNKYEELEISIERKIECGLPKKSGQSSVKFIYDLSRAIVMAIKKFNGRLAYERELKNYNIVLEKLPQFTTKLISSDEKNLTLISEKGFFDLNDFLTICIKNNFINGKEEIESFISQLLYGMIKMIEKLDKNGILHSDIKHRNIMLNYNFSDKMNSIKIKLIDWGLSISFDPNKINNEDNLNRNGSTEIYSNIFLSKLKNKGAILANDYWCLGNTILEVIEKFYGWEDLKCQYFKDFDESKISKLRGKISQELIAKLDILLSSDVLSKIPDLIQQNNLYEEKLEYSINIKNLNVFINEIIELNPLFDNFNDSTSEKMYQKAFLFLNVKPASEKIRTAGKMLLLKCLMMENISRQCTSKCLYNLGLIYFFLMRKYHLSLKILKFPHYFSVMFPEDFSNGELLKNLHTFVGRIEEYDIPSLFKNFALSALKIQNQITKKDSEHQAKFYDCVSLAFEMESDYKNAYKYQKKHASIWEESRLLAGTDTDWKFHGDIEYSFGQLLKYACFINLEEKELKYVKNIFNSLDMMKETQDLWKIQLQVYQTIFCLTKGSEEKKQEGFLNAQNLFKLLNDKNENETFKSHPYLYSIGDLLEKIYESKFFDKNPFLKDHIRKTKLFSFISFEIDKDFFEESKRVYEKLKETIPELWISP